MSLDQIILQETDRTNMSQLKRTQECSRLFRIGFSSNCEFETLFMAGKSMQARQEMYRFTLF